MEELRRVGRIEKKPPIYRSRSASSKHQNEMGWGMLPREGRKERSWKGLGVRGISLLGFYCPRSRCRPKAQGQMRQNAKLGGDIIFFQKALLIQDMPCERASVMDTIIELHSLEERKGI